LAGLSEWKETKIISSSSLNSAKLASFLSIHSAKMPMFNTSNPFRSSNSSSSSTQSSARRGPPRKTQPSSSSSSSSSLKQQPARPPPDPRLVSLSQLESATTRLSDLRKSFQIPPHLDFNPSTSTNSVPKLAYTPNNAPFHAYDEALTKLLIELDGIDSCGGEMDIRTRRKGLVLEVERTRSVG